jgi:poly-gamma-glutamate synthesis protein (capsule biosynthesis protein)
VEFHFNATAALLGGLKASGMKVVSFANNHVFDQGKKGFAETLDELDKAGLPFYGAGRTRQEAFRGLRLEKNGVKLALLGASQFFNNDKESEGAKPDQPHCNRADEPQAMVEAVKAARADADFVIVSLHWGVEYQPKPREAEVQLAHDLFEAGADVILGTHPHVLQPLEIYQASDGRTCLVIYSLGNFISNQNKQYQHGVSPEKVGDTRDGAILRFAVARRDYGAGGVRAELADVSFVPIWTENDRTKKGDAEQITIRTVPIEKALTAARADLDALTARVNGKPTKEQQAEIVRLKKRVAHYQRRRGIIEARLGADFAAEHAP